MSFDQHISPKMEIETIKEKGSKRKFGAVKGIHFITRDKKTTGTIVQTLKQVPSTLMWRRMGTGSLAQFVAECYRFVPSDIRISTF